MYIVPYFLKRLLYDIIRPKTTVGKISLIIILVIVIIISSVVSSAPKASALSASDPVACQSSDSPVELDTMYDKALTFKSIDINTTDRSVVLVKNRTNGWFYIYITNNSGALNFQKDETNGYHLQVSYSASPSTRLAYPNSSYTTPIESGMEAFKWGGTDYPNVCFHRPHAVTYSASWDRPQLTPYPAPAPEPDPEPTPSGDVIPFEQKMGVGLAFMIGMYVIYAFRYRGY